MDILQTVILAIVQGITEFLPISSSAHLILLSKLTSYKDQGLAFDIALHFGTLVAVLWYFRKYIVVLIADFFSSIYAKKLIGQANISLGILLATIPVGLVGVFYKDVIAYDLRSVTVIAYATLVFGILLGVADYINKNNINIRHKLSFFDIFFIGIAQCFALVPGVSRSGVVITAALLLGLSRELSVKFAFLLAIPVIILSTVLALFDLVKNPEFIDYKSLLIGFFITMITAYIVIATFIRFISSISFLPFVIYRVVLGVLLLLI